MNEVDKKERTVIHLEINGEHHYFGSMSNLFVYFSNEQLGTSYSSLRKFGLSEDKPYINSKCTIRKGKLHSKDKRIK